MSDAPGVLFVCTGNICRSPMAEAVMRHRAAREGLAISVDSAGTSAEKAGNPPDRRAAVVLARRGYPVPDRRARRVVTEDFVRHALILPATRAHLEILRRMAPPQAVAELRLLMSFADAAGGPDIPDPWYGDLADYEYALDLIEAAVDGLVAELRGRLAAGRG